MKIIHKPSMTWEPLVIRFVPRKVISGWEKKVLSWIEGWSQKRTVLAGNIASSQVPLEYYIANVRSDGSVFVHIEWLCDKSLPIFEKYIQSVASNILIMEIGQDLLEQISSNFTGRAIQFVNISPKTVRLEDGKTIKVPAFEISEFPVLFIQFERFVHETGYKTTAEQKQEDRTYRQNSALPPIGDPSRNVVSVTCVSYDDAIAFCHWAGVRLPTESEWLAAAILDWNNEYENPQDLPRAVWDKYLSIPEAMKNLGPEWVGEYNLRRRQAVIRYGPHYFLQKNGKKVIYRMIHPMDYFELLVQFRVCK